MEPGMRTQAIPELPGVTHRFVAANGIRLHIAESGPADGEPIVLLHGFPQHWYAWRHVMPLLASDYRVIAVDLRGFGWSDAPRGGYTGLGLADDVVALLDELGLGRVRLIGHDWGAWVGFVISLRTPERVSGFVAVNMTHPWPSPLRMIPNLWRMWHTAVFEYPPQGRLVLRHQRWFIRFLLRHWSADAGMWDREELDVYADRFRDRARARAGEQFHFQYVLHDILAHPLGRFRKAHLTVPTLILAGQRDVVVPPSILAGGERHADDLRVTVVEDGGHLLPEEWPEVVADEARAFFEEAAPTLRVVDAA
jgi:pimeloyl-ACP methyl ester carboxylesterase